jgi:hypothetical protein
MIKAEAIPAPTPTLSDLGKRNKQQAACTGIQHKAAGPEVPAVEFQPPHPPPSTPLSQSLLEGIANLLEDLPTEACIELTITDIGVHRQVTT